MYNQITTGELAKKAHVTVRTLQYYDRINLLKPTAISDGGRRLYNENDLSILHQIITLKSLGMSLKEIKEKLKPIETNQEIKEMLGQQAKLIKEKILKSQKVLESIELISDDIDMSNTVDWHKYAQMLKLIQDNNEQYWMMQFLENDLLENITQVHNKDDLIPDNWFIEYMKEAVVLIESGIDPTGETGQEFAKKIWLIISRYAKGQPEMMNKLHQFYKASDAWPSGISDLQKKSVNFIEKSINHYVEKEMRG